MRAVCFFDEFAENEFLEDGKDHCRQQIVGKRAVGGICRESDAKNVEACCAPHKAREEQQRISLYQCKFPPFSEHRSICGI